jgi:hypothetical protein
MRTGIMRTGGLAAQIAIVVLCSCTDSVSPNGIQQQLGTLSVTAIDTLGAPLTVVGMNDSGVLLGTAVGMNDSGVVVGTVTLNGVVQGFSWRAGAFTILQTSGGAFTPKVITDAGDIVGFSAGVPMVWKAHAAAPTPMFRSDTTLASLVILDANSRGEVLFGSQALNAVWKAGVYQPVTWSSISCSGLRINNQGVVLGTLCNDLYIQWRLAASPFGATSVNSTKLAGNTCAPNTSGHGVVDGAVAVNDSNEVLEGTHWQTAAGCRAFSSYLTGFNSRGLIAVTSSKFQTAMLLTSSDSVMVDQLLDASSAASWHVQVVKRVTNSGAMLAMARRVSDGAVLSVFIGPRP